MPVSVNVHLVIRSNNKSAIKMLLSLFENQIVRIGVAQVSNNIAFSVFCDLQIPQSCQVNVQSLLFDDRITVLL